MYNGNNINILLRKFYLVSFINYILYTIYIYIYIYIYRDMFDMDNMLRKSLIKNNTGPTTDSCLLL